MSRKLSCLSIGLFLFLAGFAWAQQGADIPPMLETPRPLESPDTTTPTPPSQEKATKSATEQAKHLKKKAKTKKNRAYTSSKKKSRKASGKKAKLTQNAKVNRELQRRSEAKTSDPNP